MGFRQPARNLGGDPGAAWLPRYCWRASHLLVRCCLSVLVILIIAVLLLYLRLMQGPIMLPALGKFAGQQISEVNPNANVDIANASLQLGDGTTPSGLQFQGLQVTSEEGDPLFAIPRVSMSLALGDMIHGRVQPLKVAVIEPRARLIRLASGGFRFGIGHGEGMSLDEGTGGGSTEQGLEAMSTLINGFLGQTDLPPELLKLERVEIRGADLVYDDRQTGTAWRAPNADFVIWRSDETVEAQLKIAVVEEGIPGAAIKIDARYDIESRETALHTAFGNVHAAQIAAQVPDLDWLNAVGGQLEGQGVIRIGPEQNLKSIEGVLIAENGELADLGDAVEYDLVQLGFRVDPEASRVHVGDFQIAAPGLEARFSGVADYGLGADQSVSDLAMQLDVRRLNVRLPDVFSAPLNFDGGQISAYWHPGQQTIEVADARLDRDDLTLLVDGRAYVGGEAVLADFRATADKATVQDMVALWPIAAAAAARGWVAKSIHRADITDMTAQMRIGDGEPRLALDFTYSDLTSSYLGNMSPITDASGRGHLSYHDLFLEMDAGHVEPSKGERIEIGGSSVAITELWGEITPADIEIVARGNTRAVLDLIDEDPLRLVQKLGLDPSRIGGQSTVRTRLAFPLISGLDIEQIDVDARAELSSLRMPLDLPKGQTAQVTADKLDLRADVRGMTIKGSARIDDAPMQVTWDENYGSAAGGRTLDLAGKLSATLLQRLGIEDVPFDGAPPFTLALAQSGDAPMTFDLSSDLAGSRIEVEALDWQKPRGDRATLDLAGRLGKGVTLERLSLKSDTLNAKGSARLGANGDLVSAKLGEFVLRGKADISVNATTGEDGVLDLRLAGRSLDVSDRSEDDTKDEARRPMRLRFDLDRLQLSNSMHLSNASGRLRIRKSGDLAGQISGRLGGVSPVEIEIETSPDKPGKLSLTSADAGATLQAADFYHGARGGNLRVDAVLGVDGQPEVSGRALLQDVTVQSSATFRDVLREGGLDDAQDDVSTGGLSFRKIWIPFTYDKDVITLTDAIATSSALALKVNGRVDEGTGNLDLVGVMSPAYGLTGVLDEIPVLGQILSGGEGEGILAMTFSVSGPLRDPSFSVNPLSLITPGFLRNIFTGEAGKVSKDFEQRLQTGDN